MYSKRTVFAAACAGMLLFGITFITLGSIAPDLKLKFQWEEITAATLFSILPIGILTGSLLFGPLCDRFGYKLLLVFSALLVFIGIECIAFVRSERILQFAIFLFGLGGGAINGATNAVVADISDKEKGANLSLLGVFFGIGALGMPFILGSLRNIFSFEQIVAGAGILTLTVTLFFMLIKFPPPKQAKGFPLAKSLNLIRDRELILIAFYLFCQSSFEAIINNWTTTYLTNHHYIPGQKALYALSLFVTGMTIMRLVTGSALRNILPKRILLSSLVLILIGCVLLATTNLFYQMLIGLVLLGAGLAAGFPIMLGFVGDRYAELSGTAFSFVLFVALVGNMLINYMMGIIVQSYGIKHLITVAFILVSAMVVLFFLIFRQNKSLKSK